MVLPRKPDNQHSDRRQRHQRKNSALMVYLHGQFSFGPKMVNSSPQVLVFSRKLIGFCQSGPGGEVKYYMVWGWISCRLMFSRGRWAGVSPVWAANPAGGISIPISPGHASQMSPLRWLVNEFSIFQIIMIYKIHKSIHRSIPIRQVIPIHVSEVISSS